MLTLEQKDDGFSDQNPRQISEWPIFAWIVAHPQEGLTNNYAVEPTLYYADFPSPAQARQYALQGAIAALLIVGLLLTSFAVS